MSKMNTYKITQTVLHHTTFWWGDSDINLIPDTADGVMEDMMGWVENDFDDPSNDNGSWLEFCAIMTSDKVRALIDWEAVRTKTIAMLTEDSDTDSTPEPVPASKSKTTLSLEDMLRQHLSIVPNQTAREILASFKKYDTPTSKTLTKTEINSVLYKGKNKLFVCTTEAAPRWSLKRQD